MKLSLITLGFAATAFAATPSGLWDGTVIVDKVTVPFRMEFGGTEAAFVGTFFNGSERITSTNGQIRNGVATLEFPYYGKTLTATLTGQVLNGKFGWPGKEYPFHAEPHRAVARPASHIPSIQGAWEIPLNNPTGEKSWRMTVRQFGPNVEAAILRLDGDTGTLTGSWADGHFLLSHFSGARPTVVDVTPRPDKTLALIVDGKKKLTALRPSAARAQGLPTPDNPDTATAIRDPKEPLHFRFPDVEGHIVSEKDPRFAGKVVLVEISGSWCPNCHDEAPLLEELYRKYRSQGLEVVELSFELDDQVKTLTGVRAFAKRYGIDYTVLIPGDSTQVAAKMPQIVNFGAFPTTFFVGRDGLVHGIHTGFAAKATGEMHDELVGVFTSTVRRLLAERP